MILGNTHRAENTVPAAVCFCLAFCAAAAGVPGYTLTVTNVAGTAIADYPVAVPLDGLPAALRCADPVVRAPGGEPVLCQADDLDGDGTLDELVFFADLPAGATAAYSVERGPSPGDAAAALTVAGKMTIENGRIRCRLTADDRPALAVEDAATGGRLLDRAWLPALPKTAARSRVAARGPARVAVDRAYRDGPFAVTARYHVYARRSWIRLDLLFRNTAAGEKVLPAPAGDVIRGEQGPLLTAGIRKTEIVSVGHFLSSRKNIFWLNPGTRRGFGIVMHSPHWCREIAPLWGGVYTTFDGVQVHSSPARNRHRVNVEKDGTFGVGRILPCPDKKLFRRRWKRTRVPKGFAVAAGETLRFSATLCFYAGTSAAMEKAMRVDADAAVGVVHVRGPAGEYRVVARAPEMVREDFTDLGRWRVLPGTRTAAKGGRVSVTATAAGGGICTPLSRDFDDPTEISGRVAAAEGAALKISLVAMRGGDEQVVATVAGPFRRLLLDRHTAAFAVREGYAASDKDFRRRVSRGDDFGGRAAVVACRGVRRCLLKLEPVPAGKAGRDGTAPAVTLDELSLAWPLPPPPALRHPAPDFPLTDIALGFEIRSRTPEQCERGYEVAVARGRNDSPAVLRRRWPNQIRRGDRHSRPYRVLGVEELLGVGDYVARVRGIAVHGEPGPWSKPRPFRIGNANHEPVPPVREISPRRPLIILTPRDRENFGRLWNALPPRIRALSVAKVHLRDVMADPAGWAETAARSFPLFITMSHWTGAFPDLPLYERLLATCPSVYGFWFSECESPGAYARRELILAGKYGRMFGNMRGGINYGLGHLKPGANEEWYGGLKTHRGYYLQVMKGQNPFAPVAGYANLIGLFLSGRLDHWGVETEWGMAKKTVPGPPRPVDWMAPFLVGLAYGAQVYNPQIIKHAARYDGWDSDAGRLDVLWYRAIGPFFADLLDHDLIPTREEVRAGVKVAFVPSPAHAAPAPRGLMRYPAGLMAAVHGLPDLRRNWLPDAPRYGIVPVLPVLSTKEERARFAAAVPFDRFSSPDDAIAFLNRYYPPTKNRAFAVRSGRTGVIAGGAASAGRTDDDTRRYFTMELPPGPVRRIEGTVDAREYLILKQKPGSLFLHTNARPAVTSGFTLHGRGGLSVRVEPRDALVTLKREGSRIDVVLKHDHREGVARVFVEPRSADGGGRGRPGGS